MYNIWLTVRQRQSVTSDLRQLQKMTSFKCLEFLLFLPLLCLVCCEEPEPVFRAKGNIIEMGYCFGVDYIVVYRTGPEGDQLLGNSSANSTVKPPTDMEGRIHPTLREQLLGLQISNLTHTDSGTYRRECWEEHNLVSHFTQQLFVCDEMVQSEEVVVKEGADGAEFLCNSTSIGQEGTSVHWYYEMYPSYKPIHFLDSSVSLEPMEKEMKGGVEVRQGGASLMISNNLLKNIQHFHCLVFKGKNCFSFQNMYLPSNTENKEIFAPAGERVVLNCPSDGKFQQWETPLGMINGSTVRKNEMYLSKGDKLEDFSLVIPEINEDLSGDYSCISTSLEIQFLVILCPTKDTPPKTASEGKDLSLRCADVQGDSLRVQWHYKGTTGEYNPIHDSNHTPILEHLIGRLTLSNNGTLLTLSNVKKTDAGLYRCVSIRDPEGAETGDYDYDNEYNGEQTEEDEEYEVEEYPLDEARCLNIQDTVLTVLNPVTRGPDTRGKAAYTQEEKKPTQSPKEGPTTGIVVGGIVAGLVVVAIAVAIAIWRKKTMSQPKQSENTTKQDDPDCSERLTKGSNQC